MLPHQTSFDDLGAALSEVTFVALDLETTGGSPASCAITEVGAVKMRGGDVLGTFQTLVDPGVPIPRFITHLTGIDDWTVRAAPPLEAVLPSLVEFVAGSVLVAHNARFDVSFLNAGLSRLAYPLLDGPPICTAKLAKRVAGRDVRNVRLATLAEHFRAAHKPTHRALDDALACADVFHALLDLGGRLGILTLGDLREACRARGAPHFRKIRLTDQLPHVPGVYLFRKASSEVLYVGKAKDIRARVRQYFYGDGRKKVEALLAETGAVEARPCGSELEALVTEARLIRRHEPRFNRHGRTWRRYVYLKVDTAEAWPRIKVVRAAAGEGVFLGPFGSRGAALQVKEAIEDVFPIRRCTARMARTTRFSPCALAAMGRCLAPCDGRVDPERYGEVVRTIVRSLSSDPDGLLAALEGRMARLANGGRFEEAALARDRLRALVGALARARFDGWFASAPTLVLAGPDGMRHHFQRGRLGGGNPLGTPVAGADADEAAAVRGWLTRNPVRLVEADGEVAEPVAGGAAIHRLIGAIDRARKRL